MAGLALLQAPAGAQTEGGFNENDPTTVSTAPPPTNTGSLTTVDVPARASDYFPPAYMSALRAPLPNRIYRLGGIPATALQFEVDKNSNGKNGSYQPGGTTRSATNVFFQSLGTNGRPCVTCHQPPSGMSVSVRNIKARFRATNGRDPIFAPVDGANCPNQVPAANTSGSHYGGLKGGSRRAFKEVHSLLLEKGLVRIFLPVPKDADYDITPITDPNGCNADPNYNSVVNPETGEITKIISVYRRPRIPANLTFLPTKPNNIMWDGREPSLESQAVNATLGHAQAPEAPTATQVKQIVDFEKGIFTAQIVDKVAKGLDLDGAKGGPLNLSKAALLTFDAPPNIIPFDEYDAWSVTSGSPAVAARRASINRGQAIFDTRTFMVTDVAGLNNFIPLGGPPPVFACSSWHSENNSGHDRLGSVFGGAGASMNTGVGGTIVAQTGPAPDPKLPIFEIKCKTGSTPFHGPTVRTNDPGLALISGRCADVGRFAIPSPRALSAQAPYFHDGSADTLEEVVDFYDRHFNIGLSATERDDLVNFMAAL